MSTPPPDFEAPVIVTFRAKLPDDIGADEFAALLDAIRVLDDAVVTSVSTSPEAEFFSPDLRTVAPSVVQRVRYGSDFLVVLGVIAQGTVPVAVVIAAWLGIDKSINYIADARLKNEERKGKREDRLARRRERAAAEEVVRARIVRRLDIGLDIHLLVSPELEEVAYVDGTPDVAQRPVQDALDVLIPAETRPGVEAALEPDLRTQPVAIAAAQLAEYVVSVDVRPSTGRAHGKLP